MAREKMHSTSAEEVATNGGQELDPQPTTPSKNQPNAAPPSNKKQSSKLNTNEMDFAAVTAAGITVDSDARSVTVISNSSNHQPVDQIRQKCRKKASANNTNSPSHNNRMSSSPSSGSKNSQSRSNKTLAWFISDEQLLSVSCTNNNTTTATKDTKKSKTSPSSAVDLSSDATGMKETTDKMLSNRHHRTSVNTNNNNNSTTNNDNPSPKAMTHLDERKRGKRTRQRPQKKSLESKSSSYNDVNSANNNADSTNNTNSKSEDTRDAKQPTTKGDYNKDDYWYYDPTSDGFYYENMGSRGWRRRMPVNAQKRTRMEQEMYATFLRDPSQFACLQPDLYGFLPQVTTANAAAAYYAGPQIKYYDPASDGYYFEMPSVDGWKRRQPNSSSTSSSSSASGSSSSSGATAGVVPTIAAAFLNCLNGTDFPRGAQFLHHHHAAHQQEPQVTSYGAALARGQLPPAYKLADSAVCNQDPFSSGASSMSTLSSLSEGTPTPPPHHRLNTLSSNGRNDSSIFYDDDNNYIDYVAEQCDRALQLDDMTNEDDSECCIDESVHLPSCLFDRPESPETFAAASSCDSDDVENTPPNKESLDLKRPGTLDLNAVSSSSEISDKIEENETNKMADETKSSSKRHELLLNFNADKFIADMAHYGSNVERVLRDLAALKTPVTPATTSTAAAITTPICNLDSPRTPAIYSAYPNWARAPDMATSNVCNDWWLRDTTNGTYIEDIWSESDASTAYSSTKSKLSIWRDSGLLTAVPCDNN